MKIPIYKKDDILNAILDEGLVPEAWGYKTPNCIYVYTQGMEKKEIWEKYPTPLNGYEMSWWDMNCIEPVTYFLLDDYSGNTSLLEECLG